MIENSDVETQARHIFFEKKVKVKDTRCNKTKNVQEEREIKPCFYPGNEKDKPGDRSRIEGLQQGNAAPSGQLRGFGAQTGS